MKNQSGFTLIELMITLVLAVIVMTLAIPGFREMIQNNRIITHANEVMTAINLARGEAVKRGAQVNVTAKSGTNWASGWTVATASGTGLRDHAAIADSMTLTGSAGAVNFDGRGFLVGSNDITIDVCDSSRNGETGREIQVKATGRISVINLTCS